MLPDLSPNWLAVLAAAVLSMVLGFLWYGPLFGKPWMAAMGWTEEKAKEQGKGMGKAYGLMFVLALLASIGLADVVKLAGGRVTIPEGTLLGLATAIAFVVTTNLPAVFFEGRPKKVFGIYASYQVVWFVLAGALFAAWP